MQLRSILPLACGTMMAGLLASLAPAEALSRQKTGLDAMQACMDTYDKNSTWCHTQPEPDSCIDAMKEQYAECIDGINKAEANPASSGVKNKFSTGTKGKLKKP